MLCMLYFFTTTLLFSQIVESPNPQTKNPDLQFDYYKHPLYEVDPIKTDYITNFALGGILDGSLYGLIGGIALAGTSSSKGAEGEITKSITYTMGIVVGSVLGGYLGYRKGAQYQKLADTKPGFHGTRRNWGYSVQGSANQSFQFYNDLGTSLVVRKWSPKKWIPNKLFITFKKENYDGVIIPNSTGNYSHWAEAKKIQVLFQYSTKPSFTSIHAGFGLGYADGTYNERWYVIDYVTNIETNVVPIHTIYFITNLGLEINLGDLLYLQTDIEYDPLGFYNHLQEYQSFNDQHLKVIVRVGRFIF